jgi:hypothetical protein
MSDHPDHFNKYVTHRGSVFGPIKVGQKGLESMPFLGLVEPARESPVPPEADLNTEEWLALELRRIDRKTPALLVEYMRGRTVADSQDIAVAVHDHRNTTDGAIGANCRRTNEQAERLGSPWRYEYKGSKVFKSKV